MRLKKESEQLSSQGNEIAPGWQAALAKSPVFFSDGQEMKENGVDHTVNDLLPILAKLMNFERWVSLREGDHRRTNSHQLLTKSAEKRRLLRRSRNDTSDLSLAEAPIAFMKKPDLTILQG